MKYFLIGVLALQLYWPSSLQGQHTPYRTAGSWAAHALLMQLTSPKDTEYLVGIINTAAEVGVLVSPRGEKFTAERIRGFSTERDSHWNLSWSANDLLEEASDHLMLEVVRTRIDSDDCADLNAVAEHFYKVLDAALHAPVILSEIPKKPTLNQLEQVTLGTSYIIQIWTGERTLRIYPDPDKDEALDEASGTLVRIIGVCSDGLPRDIERYWP